MCQTKKHKVISRIGVYLFRYKYLFYGTLTLACVMTILSVIAPSVIQQVLDHVLLEGIGDGQVLLLGVLLIAAIFFLRN